MLRILQVYPNRIFLILLSKIMLSSSTATLYLIVFWFVWQRRIAALLQQTNYAQLPSLNNRIQENNIYTQRSFAAFLLFCHKTPRRNNDKLSLHTLKLLCSRLSLSNIHALILKLKRLNICSYLPLYPFLALIGDFCYAPRSSFPGAGYVALRVYRI